MQRDLSIGEIEVNVIPHCLCLRFVWLDLVLVEINGAPC